MVTALINSAKYHKEYFTRLGNECVHYLSEQGESVGPSVQTLSDTCVGLTATPTRVSVTWMRPSAKTPASINIMMVLVVSDFT